ncbi:hypothetical protein [Methanothermobacter wolfeii]|uniref:hypothetical protein n=1 Tax=Methanothermobacter wolfeii TaxID=145261 RepID=UPI0024B36F3C|nr:hypothetical protein [Methanothermobacter wolfeii]MDI6702414.1 hypothetical protein [Methanothermobacter wolfeii]MDI6841951.1 hypothetical protein [Methanothermobacter wolfeii]
MKLRNITALLTVILIFGSIAPSIATGLWASPAEFRYNLQPNGSVSGEITVRNTGKEPVNVTLEKKRLLMDSVNLVYSDRGIAEWITIEGNTTFIMKPGESRKVRFTVNAPSKINYLDAAGAVVIRGVPLQNTTRGQIQITQGVELVIPIYVGLPGPIIESLRLLEHRAPSVLVSFMPGKFTYLLQNNGTVQANMTGNIEISGITGKQRVPISGVVYPEDNYTLMETWKPGWLEFGLYTATTEINYGRYHQTRTIRTSDTILVIPAWLIVLLVLGATVWVIRRKGIEPPISVKIERKK